MAKIVELSVNEAAAVAGGITSYTRVDRKTGEVVVYNDAGQEIGRYPSGTDVNQN